MSARQAAARQSIQQINDPAGSAPPFERTTAASAWTFNPGRQEERRLLEDMIVYLRGSRTNNAQILQFVFMDWPKLALSMNTKATVLKVKTTLLRLEVDFIHRTEDHYWGFWNNYTDVGLFNIHPPPDHVDITRMPTTSITRTLQTQESQKNVASYQQASMEDITSNSSDAASHASIGDHASATGKGARTSDKNDDNASGSSDTSTRRHPETPQPIWKNETKDRKSVV